MMNNWEEEAGARACEVCRIPEDELTKHVADFFKLPVAHLLSVESHSLKMLRQVSSARGEC